MPIYCFEASAVAEGAGSSLRQQKHTQKHKTQQLRVFGRSCGVVLCSALDTAVQQACVVGACAHRCGGFCCHSGCGGSMQQELCSNAPDVLGMCAAVCVPLVCHISTQNILCLLIICQHVCGFRIGFVYSPALTGGWQLSLGYNTLCEVCAKGFSRAGFRSLRHCIDSCYALQRGMAQLLLDVSLLVAHWHCSMPSQSNRQQLTYL